MPGADVGAEPAVGKAGAELPHRPARRRVAEPPARAEAHDVLRQVQRVPGVEQRPAVRHPVSVEQRGADPVAGGGQEREAHRPADQHAVGHRAHGPHHAELVGHLGAAQHHHERPARRPPQAQDLGHLGEHQRPGGAGQQPRRTDDGGVGAVAGAEGVVHEGVVASGEALGGGRVASLLAGVEAEVVEQFGARRQLAEPPAHRGHVERRVRPAAGAPQMAAHRDPGPGLAERSDRRRHLPDAAVVGDLTGVQRHVQVGAQQHAAPPQVAQISDGGHRAHRTHPGAASRRCARRGRRGGWSSPTRCRTSRTP